MQKYLIAMILALVAVAPAVAQDAGGMSTMGYYVGTWACLGGPVGVGPARATLVAATNGDVLGMRLLLPVQSGVSAPYYLNVAITYDGKGRYLQTALDNEGVWKVSSAPPLTGNTEQWTDITTSDGKPGRTVIVRTDNDHYTVTGYDAQTGGTVNFKAACQRQSS